MVCKIWKEKEENNCFISQRRERLLFLFKYMDEGMETLPRRWLEGLFTKVVDMPKYRRIRFRLEANWDCHRYQ